MGLAIYLHAANLAPPSRRAEVLAVPDQLDVRGARRLLRRRLVLPVGRRRFVLAVHGLAVGVVRVDEPGGHHVRVRRSAKVRARLPPAIKVWTEARRLVVRARGERLPLDTIARSGQAGAAVAGPLVARVEPSLVAWIVALVGGGKGLQARLVVDRVDARR